MKSEHYFRGGERKIGMGERSVRLGVNAVYGWVNLLGSQRIPDRSFRAMSRAEEDPHMYVVPEDFIDDKTVFRLENDIKKFICIRML